MPVDGGRGENSTRSFSDRIRERVAVVIEPFLVPDVTEPGESSAAVFHVLRDLCDDGVLVHTTLGYRRSDSTHTFGGGMGKPEVHHRADFSPAAVPDVAALAQELADDAAGMRARCVPGTPEKYPGTKVEVRLLALEAVLAEVERLRKDLDQAEEIIGAIDLSKYALDVVRRADKAEAELERLRQEREGVRDVLDGAGIPRSVDADAPLWSEAYRIALLRDERDEARAERSSADNTIDEWETGDRG